MPDFCLTIDLDRDVNIPVPGCTAAGSIDRGYGTAPRYTSSKLGLEQYVVLLDELSVPATFFAEAVSLNSISDSAGCLDGYEVGLHGLEHEDFTRLDPHDAKRRILIARESVYDITGTVPKSFRAPYMAMPDNLWAALSESGFNADSSYYSDELHAGRVSCGLTEVPVTRVQPETGKPALSGYLWPMHEGIRKPESYLEMIQHVPAGPFVIADHTWHIAESRKGGIRSLGDTGLALSNVRRILEGLLDLGYRPKTVSQLAALHAR